MAPDVCPALPWAMTTDQVVAALAAEGYNRDRIRDVIDSSPASPGAKATSGTTRRSALFAGSSAHPRTDQT